MTRRPSVTFLLLRFTFSVALLFAGLAALLTLAAVLQ
jgi:hypothetical protein